MSMPIFRPQLTLIAAAVATLVAACGGSLDRHGTPDAGTPALSTAPVATPGQTPPPAAPAPAPSPAPAPTPTPDPSPAPAPAPTPDPAPAPAPVPVPVPTVTGSVLGAVMKNPTGFAKSSKAGVDTVYSTTGDAVVPVPTRVAYQNARVCIDSNANNVCDSSEDSALTAADGSFSIASSKTGPLLAIVGTDATYADPNQKSPANVVNVGMKMVLRAAAEQTMASGGKQVVVSPLSTEVLRSMEADSLAYAAARTAIAARLSLNNMPAKPTDVTVTADQLVVDPDGLTSAGSCGSILNEEVALTPRYQLASKMLDRGYVTTATADPVTTLKAAQAAAFGLEGIPRYDHLFVMIFENHTNQMIDQPANVNFYNYLNVEGNKAANYISTGSPSEPNYVSIGSGDDWGITDDSGWNCVPMGDAADQPSDVYVPNGTCTAATNHNIKGRRNLFSSMYASGLGTRHYSESMDPGQDPRVDNKGNAAISGVNATTMQAEAFPGGIYKTKHNTAIAFDDVRNRPDFFRNLSRTVGGGQWDAGIAAYAKANNITWNVHQMEDDLASGDIGALNYIIPDQCDDIHGVTGAAANCNSTPDGIERGDAYAKYVVETIKASPVWKNTAKRVGIVLIFDEGSYGGSGASCCGWNSGGAETSNGPLEEGITATIANYKNGNKGDYSTIFGLVTNQPNAPKKIVDSDTYSHFSFVRTVQDMYGLSDPAVPASYMNRSKYTQSYIAAHLGQLTEYTGSANLHYDAVRPMNHSYAVQVGDMASNGAYVLAPDTTQTNIWALK